MKNYIISIIMLLFFSSHVFSQSCFPDGILFTSQEEIDLFPTNNPNCTEIEGSVEISGNDIENLDALSQLTKIYGELNIHHNQSLIQINGVSNLSILGSLIINNNPKITGISGFNAIQQIANVSFYNLENIEDISGFNEIINIENHLIFRNCESLQKIDGFQKLESIGGEFELLFNITIEEFPGFLSLTEILGNVSIINNHQIKNLSGFSSLNTVEGYIQIDKNQNIKQLSGLEQLSFIGKDLIIRYNDSLINLKGLNNLQKTGGDFKVWSCGNLFSFGGISKLDTIGGSLSLNELPLLFSLEELINLKDTRGVYIYNCNSIQSLYGLNNIENIHNENLVISNNENLHSLHGINHMDYTTIGELHIVDNDKLFYCEVESICSWVYDPSAPGYIMSNFYGCDDIVQVKRACNENETDFHSFPVLIDYPSWKVLECNNTEPLNCQTKTYEYLTSVDNLCYRIYSLMEINGDTIYIRAEGDKTWYRRFFNCWTEEYLLYDFGLDIGQSAYVGWNHFKSHGNENPDKIKMTVDKKYKQEYAGINRTVLELTYEDTVANSSGRMTWVEGIGSLTHPFYPYVDLNNESNYFELLCHDSIVHQLYQNSQWDSCDTLVNGTDKISLKDDLHVFPNPFENEVFIYSEKQKIKHLSLFSISGKKIIHKQEIIQFKYKLQLDSVIPKGMYILQVFTEEGTITKKILKQE